MVYCPKCGSYNDEDAKYCEKCGENLKRDIHSRNVSRIDGNRSNGMSTSLKALIVVCIILVVGISVAVGMLVTQPSTNTASQVTTSAAQQTPTTQQYQPTWHEVVTYTETSGSNYAFSIRGSQFKVTMSAVPMITFNNNYLDVTVSNGNNIVGSGSLSWSPNENPNKKESVIPVSQGAGTYAIQIVPTDIQSYSVTVWDYY